MEIESGGGDWSMNVYRFFDWLASNFQKNKTKNGSGLMIHPSISAGVGRRYPAQSPPLPAAAAATPVPAAAASPVAAPVVTGLAVAASAVGASAVGSSAAGAGALIKDQDRRSRECWAVKPTALMMGMRAVGLIE